MKTIFTSYYANVKKLPEGFQPIAISVGPPKGFTGPIDKRLAPTWPMMKKPREEYDRLMVKRLEKLDAQQVFDELPDNAVLLCYEKPNDWCHRRMVAEWFEKELGIVVCEFGLKREESFPYSECCEKNAGKKRKADQQQPKQERTQKMTLQEWLKSDIGCTRPDLFDVEELPGVKARRASMKRRPMGLFEIMEGDK